MKTVPNLRASERIPIGNRVKIIHNGRIVAYVLGLNLSLGGILLNAQPSLQVGGQYSVAILSPNGGKGGGIIANGTVVRNDARGTAVQFTSLLAKPALEALVNRPIPAASRSLIDTYRNYFRVSRSKHLEDCESLLGVTKAQFRTVFYATSGASVTLAVLPVWLLRASLAPFPDLMKIILAFIYGAIWFLLLQPSMDLVVFRVLRAKSGTR